MKKFMSVLLSFCLILPIMSLIVSAQTATASRSSEALKLINDQIALEMQADNYEREAYEAEMLKIDQRLEKLGVCEMSQAEVNEFYNRVALDDQAKAAELGAAGTNASSDTPPCPPSTDKIKFNWIREQVNGVWVYSVIASPVANAKHSCNTVSSPVDMKAKLGGTLKSIVQIYTDKAIGLIPGMQWVPYEIFTNLAFNGTSSSQLQMYEAKLITRTVHQFIYVKGSYDQWIYCGSANCVHINVEEIARKYVGSQLVTQPHNAYKLETAPDYYNWPTVCTQNNLNGGIVRHSYVRGVQVRVADNVAISTKVVTADLPIQVAS